MADLLTTAEELLSEGINVVAVREDKKPVHAWASLQKVMMGLDYAADVFSRAHGIAVVCGRISGNLECIDFDAHNKDIQQVYDQWSTDSGVKDILTRNRVYIERSKRGGIHLIYRYDREVKPQENRKLANWSDGQSMIETRGEGGYVITAPTQGYTVLQGELTRLPELSIDERDYLISHAVNFNQSETKQRNEDQQSTAGYDHTDPVSWFNWHKAAYAKLLLKDKGWTLIETKDEVEHWRRPGKDEGVSATWGNKHNSFYMFTTSWDQLESQVYYTPFQLLVRLRFSGDYMAALHWVLNKYFNSTEEMPYIRVGTDYYKRINKIDRFGIARIELKVWKKDEIKQDHGKSYLETIPKFDDFDIEPNNFEYTPIVRNCYNLYKEFSHKPEQGKFVWTERLIQHVFGDQYPLGLRYLQAIYLHPKRLLPILVLVSKERQTGKTTFINWLNMIFGANMVNINPEDLTSAFNSTYATSNIIAVEETLIEKSVTVEKLKALATGKFLSVNQKFVNPYKVPFFGKIILASNNEEKFARIDEEEIRFFVRKLGRPKFTNHNIEDDLVNEIPAFLHYLTTLPPVDWSRDRSGFTPDELENDQLTQVKRESKSWLYKEIVELVCQFFLDNQGMTEFDAVPRDLKLKFFNANNRVEIAYIRSVLKNEFNMQPEKNQRYVPFGIGFETSTGTPYRFYRRDFVTEQTDNELEPSVYEPFKKGYANDLPF